MRIGVDNESVYGYSARTPHGRRGGPASRGPSSMSLMPADLPLWAQWIGLSSDVVQMVLAVFGVFLSVATRGLRERPMHNGPKEQPPPLSFAFSADTERASHSSVGSSKSGSRLHCSSSTVEEVADDIQRFLIPNAGRPYAFLAERPTDNLSPDWTRASHRTDSDAETAGDSIRLDMAGSSIGNATVSRPSGHLSSPLTSWVGARLADTGRAISIDNQGWLPIGDLTVVSNPPVFRSAVNGFPTSTVVSSRLEAQSVLTLHIDDVTLTRAQEAAKFLVQPRMTVSLDVRFYDWLAEEYRYLKPFLVEIPAGSAFGVSGRTSAA